MALIKCIVDPVPAPVIVECPDGFEGHGDGCYRYEAKPSSWQGANHFCQSLGGNLAVINSGGESAAAYVATHGHNNSYWIGLKRDQVQHFLRKCL